MILRPPRSTRTTHSFPTRRSSDLLDGVADGQPGALGAGDAALDEQQAALDVRADDFQVLLGPLAVAHVTGHLLVLEDAARILAVTRRTMGAVADRHAVGGAHAAEAPALHGAGETLKIGRAHV